MESKETRLVRGNEHVRLSSSSIFYSCILHFLTTYVYKVSNTIIIIMNYSIFVLRNIFTFRFSYEVPSILWKVVKRKGSGSAKAGSD